MKEVTCPICGKRLDGALADWPTLPFCSPKCRLVDLGRWLGESYGIPAEEEPEEEGEADPTDVS
jgi:endogenous inhibitor of DNA gyrase (YacG/DUF329 family)